MKIWIQLLIVLTIVSCKKKSTPPSQTQTPAPVNHNGILKTARIQVYNSAGNFMYCVQLDYIYNSQNQHFQTTQKDSGMTGNTWSQSKTFITNYYNSFNKLSKTDYHDIVSLEYFYNQNQKIVYEVASGMSGEKDTTYYTHQTNMIVGNHKNQYGTSISYYSQNLDSLVRLDTNQNRVSKTQNSYNNTIDLNFQFFNQNLSLIPNFHELTSSTFYEYSQNPSLVETRTFTRSYDHMAYPISRTTFINGVKRECVYFSYQ